MNEGLLPPGENQRIFREEIVPVHFAGVQPQRAPVAIIIGGQTGAGKTAVTRMVKAALDQRGPCAWINMDFYNPHHPEYARWLAERPQEAAALVRPDGDLWWAQGQAYALAQGYDILLESAMVAPAEFEDICLRIRAARSPDGIPYRIEAAIVGVSPVQSRLGVMNRYLDEIRTRGYGRLVDPAVHDAAVRGVLRGAAAFEGAHLGDLVQVFRRNGEAIYSSPLDAATSPTASTTTALGAIMAEHTRTWTPREAAEFTARHALATVQAPPQAHPELQMIATLADPQRPGSPAQWRDIAEMAGTARALASSASPTNHQLARYNDSELTQSLTSVLHRRFEAATRTERTEESVRHKEADFRLTDGGLVAARLRERGAAPDVILRAKQSAREDIQYARKSAQRQQEGTRRLSHQAKTLVNELARRAAMSPEQRAVELTARQKLRAQEVQRVVQQQVPRQRALTSSAPSTPRRRGLSS
ncbi:zeta toxin family protein (plasmid) [Streptomyces sp. HU2014]|uniref:zeta toxin family protein n=1 Tax=Streptomyces sp. HU2014 TaxID=2939414 RepID=UPI00200FA2E1|nr:zeta toxin family protein [Streptomyces sp. HU2014]UQI49647.1 zeta toxin family protein [Streptomyces sp. HU2014]